MFAQTIHHTFQRYRTLQTHSISALPIVILMPHSGCNCQCIMCDIWKGNKNLKQLTEKDIEGLMHALQKFGTQQVVMSGGEALLNPNFFRLCAILKKENIRITVLSTGISLQRNASLLTEWTDEVIVSLDGDEYLHDTIRNIPGAFKKLKDGIASIRLLNKDFSVSARTVMHKRNFTHWAAIIETAKEIGLNRISFLPADISSHAFNRASLWDKERQNEILPSEKDLEEMQEIINGITARYRALFENGFIAESPAKLQKIHDHYSALYGKNLFPYKKCNAPWVSAVIEADGTVRPCFFHEAIGNIKENSLDAILNSDRATRFRKELNVQQNETCIKCVCYLNLPPGVAIS